MTQNVYKAIIRSLTPWLTSIIAAAVAHFGYHVSPTVSAEIIVFAGTGLTVAVHALETKWRWFGVFLGWLGAPAYVPTIKKSTLLATVADLQSQVTALKTSPQNGATVTVTPAAIVSDLSTPPQPQNAAQVVSSEPASTVGQEVTIKAVS